MNNIFYGKPLNELKSEELQLLAVDMQLTSLGKRGMKALPHILMTRRQRVTSVNECIRFGGDYSRSKFISDNGLTEREIPDDVVKGMEKFIDEMIKESDAEEENQ